MSKNKKGKTSSSKVLLASLIGSTIEYFDFFLYATMSAIVFNRLYFPNDDPLVSTIIAYATFGLTFFIRPVGGLIFSHMGDRVGRKNTLIMSLSLMGIATFCIGLVPTYETIGVWAPILLVFFRLLQGIGLGGEFAGAMLLAVENAPKEKRGLYGSFPQMGIPLGMLLGTFSVSILTLLPESQFLSWGWRIPFVASAGLVLIGLWIRKDIGETPVFEETKAKGKIVKVPLFETVRHHWRAVLVTLGLKFAEVGPFYIFATFFISFATDQLGYERSTALNVVTVSTLCTVVLMPFMGALSDKIGRKRVFLTGALCLAVYPFPYYYLITSGSTFWLYAASIFGLGILWPSIQATIGTVVAEMFDANISYTGITLGYQTGSGFGGTAPMIAAILLGAYNNSWVPIAIYLSVLCLISALSISLARVAKDKTIEVPTITKISS